MEAETPQRDPWYAPGLNFTCTQCGNCCTGPSGAIWVDEAELQAIAELTGTSLGEVRYTKVRLIGDRMSLREFPNGDCVYLDPQTRRCSIYSARPKQCRTWPFWNSNLESPTAWQSVQQTCPGAGHGQFVPLEQIERLAVAIDL